MEEGAPPISAAHGNSQLEHPQMRSNYSYSKAWRCGVRRGLSQHRRQAPARRRKRVRPKPDKRGAGLRLKNGSGVTTGQKQGDRNRFREAAGTIADERRVFKCVDFTRIAG
ncbi:hypothetical protein SKAU_G00298370 [Synaphobranchus kaupii]|uniref:Uncharacterized protein n=1 Tax=Synaphobranchus kaupii TaxID=118154 RepID=A0A9Q1IMS7_SYNKA|nr:hypothetical protein SKAU_G00298370 [Synaphobranchus kaupii]